MTRRWFLGYDVAAVAALATALTAPGQTFVVSQLNTSLREAFGLSELLLNASYTVATVAAALPLVLTGRLTDRFGPRRTLAVVALLFGLGCLALSAAQGPVSLCLAFFCLRFFGQGSLSLVSQHAVAMWFHERLGRIHGVSQVAVFGLWTFAPPLTVALIAGVGWRGTYVVFALAIWLLVVPAALLFMRDRPDELGLALDGGAPKGGVASTGPELTLREASRTQTYWILAALFVIGPLVGTGVLFDIQPLLGARGIDAAGAAWAVSAFSLATGVMALPAGWLTDRFRPAPLLTGGMLCTVGSAIGLVFVSEAGQMNDGGGLFGDGIEEDRVAFGVRVRVRVATAARRLRVSADAKPRQPRRIAASPRRREIQRRLVVGRSAAAGIGGGRFDPGTSDRFDAGTGLTSEIGGAPSGWRASSRSCSTTSGGQRSVASASPRSWPMIGMSSIEATLRTERTGSIVSS